MLDFIFNNYITIYSGLVLAIFGLVFASYKLSHHIANFHQQHIKLYFVICAVISATISLPCALISGNYLLRNERAQISNEINKLRERILITKTKTEEEWLKSGIGMAWPSKTPYPLLIPENDLCLLMNEFNSLKSRIHLLYSPATSIYLTHLEHLMNRKHVITYLVNSKDKNINNLLKIRGMYSFTARELATILKFLSATNELILQQAVIYNLPTELQPLKALPDYIDNTTTDNDYFSSLYFISHMYEIKGKATLQSRYIEGLTLFRLGMEDTAANILDDVIETSIKAGDKAEERIVTACVILFKYYRCSRPDNDADNKYNKAEYFSDLASKLNNDAFAKIYNQFEQHKFYDSDYDMYCNNTGAYKAGSPTCK